MKNLLLASFHCSLFSVKRNNPEFKAHVRKRVKFDSGKGFDASLYRINPKRDEWQAVVRARDAMRNFHYSITVPYKHGAAILNPLAVDEYRDRFAQYQKQFFAAVDNLLANTEDIKSEMRKALTDASGNCWFRESDYNGLNRAAFGFDVVFEPLEHDATFDRFAEIIGAELADDMKRKLADANAKAFQESCESVAQRLVDQLRHTSDRLHNGSRIWDSVMDNLQDLTEMLPVLNIADNAEIEGARRELVALFRAHSSETVKDKSARKSCAVKVDEILAKFPGK